MTDQVIEQPVAAVEEQPKSDDSALESSKILEQIETKARELEAGKDSGESPISDPVKSSEPEKKPAEGKDGDRPPEKVDDPVKQPAAEDEEPVPDKPDKAWFIKERQKRRELKDQVSVLEKRLAEQHETQPQKPDADAPPAQRENDGQKVREVFRQYAKALLGEFPGDEQSGMSAAEQNRRVLQYGRMAIDKEFSTDELNSVLEEATQGMFGQHSNEIAEAARQALPVALSRERKESLTAEEQQKDLRAMQEKIQKDFSEAKEKFPAFFDPKTPEYKHTAEWTKTWLGEYDKAGTVIKPGMFDKQTALYIATHPTIHAQLVLADMRSSQVATLTEEKKRLESEIQRTRQPESGGGAPSGTESLPAGSDGVKAKLAEKFGSLDS